MTVYAIRAGNTDAVKIGHSRNVEQRLATLQVGNPEPLHVIRTWPGTLRHEAAAHFVLRSVARGGEWFTIPVDRELFHLQAITLAISTVAPARTFNENLAEANELLATGREVECSSCSVGVESDDAVFCVVCEALHCPTCSDLHKRTR